MCVAVVVESKEDISSENLKAMHDANDDGGGVAWVDGPHVRYRKGLTWQEIDELQKVLPRPFFMHFRIATKGGIKPELTHPFPIGINAFSSDLTGTARAVLMHNGTWYDYRKYLPKFVDEAHVSDTQVAAYAAFWDEDILDDVKWSNAVMRVTEKSKAKITLRGQWSIHEGNRYSNLHWQPRSLVYGHGWSESDFEDWLDWRNKRTTPANGVYASRAYASTPPNGVYTPTNYGNSLARPYAGASRYNRAGGTYSDKVVTRGGNVGESTTKSGVVYTPDSGPIAKPENYETERERRSRLKREKIIRQEEKRNRRKARKAAKETAPTGVPIPLPPVASEVSEETVGEYFERIRRTEDEALMSQNPIGDGETPPTDEVEVVLSDEDFLEEEPTLELNPKTPTEVEAQYAMDLELDEKLDGAVPMNEIELEDLIQTDTDPRTLELADLIELAPKPTKDLRKPKKYLDADYEEVQAQIQRDGIKIVSEP